MDFWSRLLSHGPLSTGNARRDIARDPLRRRIRFDKEYGQLLQTWRNSSNLVHDIGAADTIELRIQELSDMLVDESRRPLPHTCLSFAGDKQIYIPIGKIAATSYNIHIIREAVRFFGTLIESEDEMFVESESFATSWTNLVARISGSNGLPLDRETKTKIVELAFNITTKIRLRPDILSAWFRVRQSGTHEPSGREDSRERFRGKTQRQDFPLFYVLMDYIHSEGKIGDFARTGLLYIIEKASVSAALEQWIVESDLSTLMATGLGALYSQLSRKLVIDYPADDLPPILAMSDYEHPRATFEIVSSCSSEFQVQLDTFLSHLLFWQDVLNHCQSVEVKSTLLEHFQVIFLQQLLYPSLLESSDIDGGSSVAVLTYLRRILESLDHPDMINLILHYLLALPDTTTASSTPSKTAVSAARKRKSMDLATMMAAKPEPAATPLLFNLVDLILACLKSHSQQTIHVTLQLLSVILRRHHRYAVTTLLRTSPVLGTASRRTVGAHGQDLEFFMAIADVVAGEDDFDEVYQNNLRDAAVRLESHPCSLRLIAPKVSINNHDLPAIPDSLPGAPCDVRRHAIRPDDPLLSTILDRLETFFVNPIDTNLSITEAILNMATCGFVSVEGWLLRHPDGYVFDDNVRDDRTEHKHNHDQDQDHGHGHDREAELLPRTLLDGSHMCAELHTLASMKQCRRRPRWEGIPRFLTVLQGLSDQVISYRQTIPRFDDLLQQRREAFQTANSVTPPATTPARPNPMATPLVDRTNLDSPRGDPPVRPSALEGFAQRILEFGTPSRSGSPRGRKDAGNSSASASGAASGGHGFATPTAAKLTSSVPPKEFPMSVDGSQPKGSVVVAIASSPSHEEEQSGSPAAMSSQSAAFEAVDRQILARHVGLCTRTTAEKNLAPRPQLLHKPPAEDESGELDDGSVSVLLEASVENTNPTPEEEQTATVSHILTNTIVLQSFVMEVVALLQVRAGLFDEVRFV